MTGHGSRPARAGPGTPDRPRGPAGRRGGPDADGARRTARPPAGPPPRAGRGRGPCAGCPPPSRTGAGHGSSRRSGGRRAPFGGTTGRPGGPAGERACRGPPRAGRAGRASGDRSGELDGPVGLVGPPVACGERPRAVSGRVPVPGVGPASPRPGPRRPEAVPSARSACRCAAGDGYRPAVPEGPSAGAKGGRPRSAGPRPRWRARTTVRARRRPGGRGAKSRLGAGGLAHRSPAEPASGTGVDRSLTPAGSIALIALPSLRKRFGNAYENYCTANTSAGFRVPGIGANPAPPRENALAG